MFVDLLVTGISHETEILHSGSLYFEFLTFGKKLVMTLLYLKLRRNVLLFLQNVLVCV